MVGTVCDGGDGLAVVGLGRGVVASGRWPSAWPAHSSRRCPTRSRRAQLRTTERHRPSPADYHDWAIAGACDRMDQVDTTSEFRMQLRVATPPRGRDFASGRALHERQFVGAAHKNARQSQRLTGRQTHPLRRLVITRPRLEDHACARRCSVLAGLAEPERRRVVDAHTDRFAGHIATHIVEKCLSAAALVPRPVPLRIRVVVVLGRGARRHSRTTASHGQTAATGRRLAATDLARGRRSVGRYGHSWVGPPACSGVRSRPGRVLPAPGRAASRSRRARG